STSIPSEVPSSLLSVPLPLLATLAPPSSRGARQVAYGGDQRRRWRRDDDAGRLQGQELTGGLERRGGVEAVHAGRDRLHPLGRLDPHHVLARAAAVPAGAALDPAADNPVPGPVWAVGAGVLGAVQAEDLG